MVLQIKVPNNRNQKVKNQLEKNKMKQKLPSEALDVAFS